MQLTPDCAARAATFLREQARPLERARYRHGFEGGAAEPVREALATFQRPDGGFGAGLEPDIGLPDSNTIATTLALRTLRELNTPADHPLVRGAVAWLVDAFEPGLGGWRCVPPEVDAHPHAFHWSFELHADDGSWPVRVHPQGEILAHLFHYPVGVKETLLRAQSTRWCDAIENADASLGADSLVWCEWLVRTPAAPTQLRATAERCIRELGLAMVSRDPGEWAGYVAKPFKLAPSPDAVLAGPLAEDVALSLDYEIERQSADGSWTPNWTWMGKYPEAWEAARHAWCGILTLETLRSLAAYDRLAPS